MKILVIVSHPFIMVDWDFVKEILITLITFVYYFLDGIIRAVLPACVYGKDISGETVLVTGSGKFIFLLVFFFFFFLLFP